MDPATRLSLMETVHGDIAEQLHTKNAHFGRDFLRREVCKRFQWNKMTIDIDNFKRSCVQCARSSTVYLRKGMCTIIEFGNLFVWQFVNISVNLSPFLSFSVNHCRQTRGSPCSHSSESVGHGRFRPHRTIDYQS